MSSIDSIQFLHHKSLLNLDEDKLKKYIKPGNIVDDQLQIEETKLGQYPLPVLDSKDYVKRFQFDSLKATKLEAMC
jgi:hypothetical protein